MIDRNIIRSVLLSTTSSTYKETFASSPVVERFKKESITGFFVHRDKKRSHCREVVVSGRHPATVALFAGFLSSLLSARRRVVPRISSCRVNTTSRRVINQLGISFGPIFLLFSYGSGRGPRS